MRTKKVETNEIFGNALTTDKTADTEVKETGKPVAKKPATAKSSEKKTVKEAVAEKKEDVAAKINEVKADIAEKKEEAKAVVEEAKAVVTEAKAKAEAAPAKKRGRKPAAEKAAKPAAKKTTRKTTAKKETAKKEPVKKEAETKPAVKRTTRKTTAKKALKKEVFFQYEGNQIDEETLLARIIEDAKSQNVEISELEMYIKPEDKACYYVANGFAGKVDLF